MYYSPLSHHKLWSQHEIAQKCFKLTSFLQQLKLTDANMVFYDVQHKHLC